MATSYGSWMTSTWRSAVRNAERIGMPYKNKEDHAAAQRRYRKRHPDVIKEQKRKASQRKKDGVFHHSPGHRRKIGDAKKGQLRAPWRTSGMKRCPRCGI